MAWRSGRDGFVGVRDSLLDSAVFITLLSLVGLSFLLEESTERIFIGISLALAALSLLPAYFRKHGKLQAIIMAFAALYYKNSSKIFLTLLDIHIAESNWNGSAFSCSISLKKHFANWLILLKKPCFFKRTNTNLVLPSLKTFLMNRNNSDRCFIYLIDSVNEENQLDKWFSQSENSILANWRINTGSRISS